MFSLSQCQTRQLGRWPCASNYDASFFVPVFAEQESLYCSLIEIVAVSLIASECTTFTMATAISRLCCVSLFNNVWDCGRVNLVRMWKGLHGTGEIVVNFSD